MHCVVRFVALAGHTTRTRIRTQHSLVPCENVKNLKVSKSQKAFKSGGTIFYKVYFYKNGAWEATQCMRNR